MKKIRHGYIEKRAKPEVDRPLEIVCLGLIIGMVVYMFWVGTA